MKKPKTYYLATLLNEGEELAKSLNVDLEKYEVKASISASTKEGNRFCLSLYESQSGEFSFRGSDAFGSGNEPGMAIENFENSLRQYLCLPEKEPTIKLKPAVKL